MEYLIAKWLHVLSSTILFGTGIGTAFYIFFCARTNDSAIVAAVIIWLTGWTPIDPILSVFVSLLILRSGWALLMRTFNILMEGAPEGFDPEAVKAALVQKVQGLASVGHLHVWSLSSGQTMATLEIGLDQDFEPQTVTDSVKAALAEDHKIAHATVEIDWSGKAAHCPTQHV